MKYKLIITAVCSGNAWMTVIHIIDLMNKIGLWKYTYKLRSLARDLLKIILQFIRATIWRKCFVAFMLDTNKNPLTETTFTNKSIACRLRSGIFFVQWSVPTLKISWYAIWIWLSNNFRIFIYIRGHEMPAKMLSEILKWLVQIRDSKRYNSMARN